MLISETSYKRISCDHRCNNEEEVNRIKQSGGSVFSGRVDGQLMLTRALGDRNFKSHGVTSIPHIERHVIYDGDKYIVIASDGIWDVIDDEYIYKLSKTILNVEEFANQILKFAINRGSRDNMSCIALKL